LLHLETYPLKRRELLLREIQKKATVEDEKELKVR
jgi:hypothetical protein